MLNKTIKIVTLDGYKLELFEGDEITKTIQKYGVYDPNTLKSIVDITHWLRPSITLDIGANVGNHSMLLAKHSEQVFAFEPVSQVYELLTKNIKTNNQNNITPFKLALSNTSGEKVIYLNEGNIGSSSLHAFENASEEQLINTIEGDAFLTNQSIVKSIDFIKIDVEGFEGEVIEGLENSINSDRPVILMEWRTPSTRLYFEERKLFKTIFKSYKIYSLGSTTSKKSIGSGLLPTIKRLFNKLTDEKWGLYSFDPSKSYSNIYLIPNEKINIFEINKKIN